MSKLLADGGHVVGADISKTLLDHAKSKFSDIDTMTFVHCDAQNYSFDENYFDKVISRFGVMFFESPSEAFKKYSWFYADNWFSKFCVLDKYDGE